MNKLFKVDKKLSPLWRYSSMLFIVQRLGDVINAYIALFLVPRYVPKDELGAVLPLLQVSVIIGMPVSVLIYPFGKVLNAFSVRNELGKVKRLLRDTLVFSFVVFVAASILSAVFLPKIISRMRIENGRLAYFVVITGIVCALSPVFTTALQALRSFGTIYAVSFGQSVLRLLIMLVTLPIRGLTGYFSAQSATGLFSIVSSSAALYRKYFRNTEYGQYSHDDKMMFIRWLIPVAVSSVVFNTQTMVEMWSIRGLPEIQSAAYYHITRLSEIVTYMGGSVMFVLFPIASAKYENGGIPNSEMRQSVFVTFLSGAAVAVFFFFAGPFLMRFVSIWKSYSSYAHCLPILTLVAAFRVGMGCFTTCRVACGNFRHLFFTIPISLCESAALILIPQLSDSLARISLTMLLFAAASPIAAVIVSYGRGRKPERLSY